MASEDVQTNLRLPADLKELLQATATKNKRSLSAEAAHRLLRSFDHDPQVLQPGERSELERERLSLELLYETMLTRVLAQKEALDRNKKNSAGNTDPDERAAYESWLEATKASILEAEQKMSSIKGRMLEIATDLQLRDHPNDPGFRAPKT